MIVVDAHEPKIHHKLGDKVDVLTAGDYLIEGCRGKIVVERKMVDDLIHSLHGKDKGTGDSRFWNQVKMIGSMKEDGYTPFVVVVGSLDYYFSKGYVSFKEWWNTQLAVARCGVNFAVCKNMTQFKTMLDCWDLYVGDMNYEYKRPTISKGTRNLEQERADMLASVSMIGMKTAERMVKEFGCVANMVPMLESGGEDSDLIKMIGVERFKHLKEVIG